MKTAGEIKTALGMCRCGAECNFCPYTFSECSKNQLEKDALQYIAQLEAELETVKRERDALLKYLTDSHFVPCDICKHQPESGDIMACDRVRKVNGPCFEWRGLCDANGGIHDL